MLMGMFKEGASQERMELEQGDRRGKSERENESGRKGVFIGGGRPGTNQTLRPEHRKRYLLRRRRKNQPGGSEERGKLGRVRTQRE